MDIRKVEEIALNAGKILLEKLQSGVLVEKKGAIDLITDADRASEEYILQELKKHFPESSILAEEQGLSQGVDQGSLWVVDPLMATNFAHGFPYFSVSIALISGGVTYGCCA